MEHTAAEYEKFSSECIAEGDYVGAQIFATLAVAAATLEAMAITETVDEQDIHETLSPPR